MFNKYLISFYHYYKYNCDPMLFQEIKLTFLLIVTLLPAIVLLFEVIILNRDKKY